MNTSNITNYKPKDFAELLGVSVKTLQRWDREGTLKANRTPTDRRYYTYDQYLQFKGINIENDKRQVVIYARVSTRNQKDDLQNQVAFLRQFCNAKGIIIDQSSAANRKQELRARLWGYNKLIGLHGIISCYKVGCQTAYDMAEHLGVTEEFLLEALQCYRNKYGVCIKFDNYVIYFEPGLSVLELI